VVYISSSWHYQARDNIVFEHRASPGVATTSLENRAFGFVDDWASPSPSERRTRLVPVPLVDREGGRGEVKAAPGRYNDALFKRSLLTEVCEVGSQPMCIDAPSGFPMQVNVSLNAT